MERNGSNIWPYVIVGSAIGGAVGYLFMTESGRRIRRTIANPEELSGKLEDARLFLERKSTEISDQVRSAVNKAKQSMEAGQQAFREAEQNYQSQFRGVERKNDEIASNVHKAVDNLNKTARTLEDTILDPLCELGAIYRGVERGIRTFVGPRGQVSSFYKNERVQLKV